MPELADRRNWKSFAKWAATYGSAFTLKAFFGVRALAPPLWDLSKPFCILQMRVVFVHDPLAIHHIMVKDLESWPKGVHPSEYVPACDGRPLRRIVTNADTATSRSTSGLDF